VIEMNASVQRLDLSDALARRAKEKGVMLTIGSDAHSVGGLSKAHGIIQAQRAWLTKEDIVTTKSVADFSKWLEKAKK
jgi:DNA polymerase (family 10)